MLSHTIQHPAVSLITAEVGHKEDDQCESTERAAGQIQGYPDHLADLICAVIRSGLGKWWTYSLEGLGLQPWSFHQWSFTGKT